MYFCAIYCHRQRMDAQLRCWKFRNAPYVTDNQFVKFRRAQR